MVPYHLGLKGNQHEVLSREGPSGCWDSRRGSQNGDGFAWGHCNSASLPIEASSGPIARSRSSFATQTSGTSPARRVRARGNLQEAAPSKPQGRCVTSWARNGGQLSYTKHASATPSSCMKRRNATRLPKKQAGLDRRLDIETGK